MSTEVMPQVPSTIYYRVLRYPMVSSAIDQVSNVYSMSKEKSGLVRYTFEAAEKSVALAAATAKPVVDRCEKPIAMVNGYACKQLDKLEEKVPIINEPTEKVVSKVKNETWKVIDNSKKSSTAYVSGLADTRVGNLVTSGVNTALKVTEYAVDYYLPSDEENMSDDDQEQVADEIVERPCHSVVVDEEPGSVKRVANLSSKVRRRLYQRAIKKVQYIQKRSQETIDSLHFTVDLIDYAKKNIDSANENVRANVRNTQETLWKTWNDWTTTEEDQNEQIDDEVLDNDDNQAEAAEMKTLAIARVLSKRLRVLSGNLATTVSMMPQNIRVKVNEGYEVADALFHTLEEVRYIRELPNNVITLARQQLNSLQEITMNVGDYLLTTRPLQWLIPQQVRTCEQEPEMTMEDVKHDIPKEKESNEVENNVDEDEVDEDEVDEEEFVEYDEENESYVELVESESSDTEI